MSLDVQRLRDSFDLVVQRSPNLTVRFYEIFFERYPQVRPLFGGRSTERQQKMLTEALVAVVDHLEDAPWLAETLHALGAKHLDYGVRDEMYGWVGECLLATLAEVAADEWNEQTERAWSDALGAIAGLALDGARKARGEKPTSHPTA